MSDTQRKKIEGLFARHSRGVGSYLYARVGDAELAEEITARVFLTVVRKFSQCRRSPGGWLWSIVQTELARHFRDRRRHAGGIEELPAGGEFPEQTAIRREAHAKLSAALSQLPRDHQAVIYMKFFQDMPNVEIARVTGLTTSNVGVMAHRSLKRLRVLMDGVAPPESAPGTGRSVTSEARS